MYPFNKKPFKKQASPIQPILPLVRIATTADDDKEKAKYITFTLKVCAGGNTTSPTYKKAMLVFEDGTPQEWMDVLTGVREIWRQNSIANAQDRAATVSAIVKGDSLTAFEAADGDARTRLLTLDATASGLALARTGATADAHALLVGAFVVADFVQFHVPDPFGC